MHQKKEKIESGMVDGVAKDVIPEVDGMIDGGG